MDDDEYSTLSPAAAAANTSVFSPFSSDCPICFEVFDDGEHTPRLMKECGHTVCEECIEMMLGAEDFASLPPNQVRETLHCLYVYSLSNSMCSPLPRCRPIRSASCSARRATRSPSAAARATCQRTCTCRCCSCAAAPAAAAADNDSLHSQRTAGLDLGLMKIRRVYHY